MAKAVNYAALCAYAGEHLDFPIPEAIVIGSGEAVPDVSAAVYVAIDIQGDVQYVGSVIRRGSASAAADRLSEHLRTHSKFATWNEILIIPLKPETTLEAVRRVEGRIGAHLRPKSSRALPRLRKRT